MSVSTNYAYVADGGGGLRVIDVLNPVAPAEVGFYDTPGLAYGIAVVDIRAYVGVAQEGLRVVDVSNPAAPVEIGFCNTVGTVHSVVVEGNYAYVAARGEFRVIDVSNNCPGRNRRAAHVGSCLRRSRNGPLCVHCRLG